MGRAIHVSMGHVVITFDVSGQAMDGKVKKCKTLSNKLQNEFAALLSIDRNNVEIAKPMLISNGLSVTIHVFGKDDALKEINFEQILIDSKNNGQIAEIMKDSWNLMGAPLISNVETKFIESKTEQRMKNIEMMKATIDNNTVSINNF